MVTLGLDASTTCVGYAFTQDKKILDMGFIDIKKEKTPKEKVEKVLGFLNKNSYIDDVFNKTGIVDYSVSIKKDIATFTNHGSMTPFDFIAIIRNS